MARPITTEVARRFQRAVRLDVDFGSRAAIADYVPLAASLGALTRIGEQIANSSQRAFTWTGPYGGGKSSLALVLASLLDHNKGVRRAAEEAIGSPQASRIQKAFKISKGGWLIVPVVGQRDSVVRVLDDALSKALRRRFEGRIPNSIAKEAGATPDRLLKRLTAVAEACAPDNDGILIVVDEMGRFLEHAATTDGDISFLQELAEIAGRLEQKVVIVGVLHQSFEQYALRLGSDGRDEWAKIQGRFVDVPLATGPEDTVRLIAEALVGDRAPRDHAAVCGHVASFVKERRVALPADFSDLLRRCWPLHPAVALLLASVARRRFGQNERSTFGFLNSGEPGGFQDFLSNASSRDALYGLEDFWNYLRLNLEPAILASSDGHRWAQAAEAIERAESKGDRAHVVLAKAIATLDLFGAQVGLYADDRLVRSGGLLGLAKSQTSEVLEDLRTWSIAVYRAHNKSWAVFAGSDFDIDAELGAAKAKVEVDYASLQEILTQQVVIAKRHYYESGTLRWFDVRICALGEIAKLVDEYRPTRGACGLFVLAIPSGREALEVVRIQSEVLSEQHAAHPFFVGVSKEAWEVRALTLELTALEYVRKNVGALEGDQVARRELAARSAALREQLDQKLGEMLGAASWYRGGRAQPIKSIADLTRAASDCASEFFHAAPTIKNELINRSRPSSNAVSASNELMRLMVLHSSKPALGIDGYPPQRAIYESVLVSPGLHRRSRQAGEGFEFGAPNAKGTGKTFAAMWSAGESFLDETERSRLSLSLLYDRWAKPPYGIRAGVIPIYALALILAHEPELAVYLDGQFVPSLDAFFVDRMLQDPRAVEVRRFRITGVARATLERLSELVMERAAGTLSLDALSVAKPLVAFVRSLHPWVKRTRTLSATTIACRDCILKAADPVALLFEDLPKACGTGVIRYNGRTDPSTGAYTATLRHALDELRSAYPRLLDKIALHIGEKLGGTLATESGRFELSERAAAVAGLSGDFRLDAFANRLKIATETVEWLESIGGLTGNKPVRDWIDNDIDRSTFEIADLCARFKRVEAVAKTVSHHASEETVAVVVGQGTNTKAALIRTVEISSAEKEIAKEVLNDLRSRFAAKGLAPSRLLSVVTEITREVIAAHDSTNTSDQAAPADVKEPKTWRN